MRARCLWLEYNGPGKYLNKKEGIYITIEDYEHACWHCQLLDIWGKPEGFNSDTPCPYPINECKSFQNDDSYD